LGRVADPSLDFFFSSIWDFEGRVADPSLFLGLVLVALLLLRDTDPSEAGVLDELVLGVAALRWLLLVAPSSSFVAAASSVGAAGATASLSVAGVLSVAGFSWVWSSAACV